MDLNNKVIYFDHAATTSPLKEVVSIYNDALSTYFYNPASNNFVGGESKRMLDKARYDMLDAIHSSNHEIIYTSGATEANNLAIKGFAHRYAKRGKHIISSSVEHPSIVNTLKALEKEGFEITLLPVDSKGKVILSSLKEALRKDTILVSIMAINNEVGAIQDINGILDILKDYPNTKFHVDAVQAIGKINLPFSKIDMITISLHKIGGLKSSGLLIKRDNIELCPLIDGGGQEKGIRSGTNDRPVALASSYAFKNAIGNTNKSLVYIKELVKPIYDYLYYNPTLFEVNSSIEFPFIINFSTLTKKASVVTEALSNKGIMVATKSACSSRVSSSSYVLLAMGKNENIASNSIRLSFAMTNTKEEVDYFVKTLDETIKELRA